MKFGVLYYKPIKGKTDIYTYNIGDNVQSHAIRKIYNYMGIENDNIIKVNICELASYDGEYVILPMAHFFPLLSSNVFPISKKIIPVYIGFHFSEENLTEELIHHFRNYQPIGCRDEYTLNTMRKYNIIAYLSGCVTATLPKRLIEPKHPKVFLVDIPEDIIKLIPENIMKRAEVASHILHYNRTIGLGEKEISEIDNLALKQYKKYRDEASLIITTRLHCASPSIAMGIPTILLTELYSYTFLAVDKYVHIYTPHEFDIIDWNPKSINYEEEKKQLIDLFSQQLRDTYEKYNKIYNVSSFYENRPKYDYESGYRYRLEELKNTYGDGIKCSIWGATIYARAVLKSLPKVFDNYEIVDIIDEYKEGDFYGYQVKKSACIKNHDDDVIYIIVGRSAEEYAGNMLNKLNRKFVCITR